MNKLSLITKMLAGGGMKDAFSMLSMASMLPFKLMAGSDKDVTANPEREAWEDEREDILERANWLCGKVIKSPEALMQEAPAMIGREFQGEWAIYSCSMLTHALANISHIYPDTKAKCLELIPKLIDIVNTPTIREYDTMQWKEDAMQSLDGDKHHMTYLSILAWMITNYLMIGGDDRYNDILHKCCEALNRRMLKSKYDLNLLSFPGKPIWLPDMMVTIVALRNYGRLFGGKYDDTVEAWLHNAKTKWIHKWTGSLAGQLPGQSRRVKGIVMRGSHVGLVTSYMTLVDEAFALDQHLKMKKHWLKDATLFGNTAVGIKEYLKASPEFSMKAGDAGIIVKGISAAGTAFAIGSATYFGDWKLRYEFLRTAELAGGTKKEKGKRHYTISDMFLVGEATALAMRTNVKR